MSSQKKFTADLLFGVQIICTFIFGGSQFLRMTSTSQGVGISWFICWEIFLLLNLALAIRAHKNQPSRVTLQTILSYAAWTTMVLLDLVVILWKSIGKWNSRDNITIICAALGTVATLVIANRKHKSITNPIVKGCLAIFFKAVPQLTLAFNILNPTWTTLVFNQRSGVG